MRPIVRVLIVTDDGLANGGFLQWGDQVSADATGPNSREFHLGEFVSVLTGYSWLGFDGDHQGASFARGNGRND